VSFKVNPTIAAVVTARQWHRKRAPFLRN
jgi:hypothetical protein